MLTDRNQLPPLQAIERPDFESYFAKFKSDLVNNLRILNTSQADEVEAVLAIEGELITKMGEQFILYLITNIEAENEKARQMLPAYAKGNNLDHVVSCHGLERQVIDTGDPNAIPPIPPSQENDDHLLQRYWLAPHAPAAGSRLQYRFQGLTLDERPTITLDKPAENQVRLTYTYESPSLVTQIRDANGRRTAPGEVTLTVLSDQGDGTADQSLLDVVSNYFDREDVRPETDHVLVKSATPIAYTQIIQIWLYNGPDTAVIKTALENDLQDYANQQHRLEGKVLRSYIDHLAHAQGAHKVKVDQPVADIEGNYFEAPYCTAITVTVNTL